LRCDLIAIGASAGGLTALTTLLKPLARDFPAIVVVQHLDPSHKSILASLLARKTAKEVREARDGEPLLRGVVYVGPPNEHTVVEENHIRLLHSALVKFSRPSIDMLFLSVAKT
jgi:two-component system chemotaxis response regulator CheB